jgi:amino acid transporter
MIATCAAWNVLGASAVGEGSIWLNVLLFLPFLVLVVFAFTKPAGTTPTPRPEQVDLLGGLLVAMWNYMGWDNLSTIADEVENPQRTYPLAMFCSVILVTLGYLLPVLAVAHLHLDLNIWTAGGWVDAGKSAGGPILEIAVAAAGAIGALGTFATLMLSFTRLPAVMAKDGFLPKIFSRHSAKTNAPWVAILVCAAAWALCLPLGFVKILILDVLLTGLSILLEFWALVALRIREPNLARPYRVPGGLPGVIAIGIPPLCLMFLGLLRNHSEEVGTTLGTTNELMIGLAIIALGVGLYFASPGSRRKSQR